MATHAFVAVLFPLVLILLGAYMTQVKNAPLGDVKFREGNYNINMMLKMRADERFKEILAEYTARNPDGGKFRLHGIFSVEANNTSNEVTVLRRGEWDLYMHSFLSQPMYVTQCENEKDGMFFTESTGSILKSISYKCGRVVQKDLERPESTGYTHGGDGVAIMGMGFAYYAIYFYSWLLAQLIHYSL